MFLFDFLQYIFLDPYSNDLYIVDTTYKMLIKNNISNYSYLEFMDWYLNYFIDYNGMLNTNMSNNK